jgi:hypothetical protein
VQTRGSVVDDFFLVVEADGSHDRPFGRSEDAVVKAIDNHWRTFRKVVELTTLLKEAAESFAKSGDLTGLSEMAHLQSDVWQYPQERQKEDERSSAIWGIQEWVRRKGDFGVFAHIASKLSDLHVGLDNCVEAAEALWVAADVLSLDDTGLIAESHRMEDQPRVIVKGQF